MSIEILNFDALLDAERDLLNRAKAEGLIWCLTRNRVVSGISTNILYPVSFRDAVWRYSKTLDAWVRQ
jgi:hypothetical protein